jgi:exonuclease I
MIMKQLEYRQNTISLCNLQPFITDLDFNEIERADIRCQLSPHILPAPKALHVTGVNPNQLLNNNLPTAFETRSNNTRVYTKMGTCNLDRI